MNGYIIALVLLVVALIIWLYMLAHRLLWSECKHVIDQHLGRHLALGLGLFALLAIVLPPATYQMGFDHGVTYGASYFQQHYRHPGLKTWKRTAAATKAAPVTRNLPAVQSISMAHYWVGGDQGQVGECAGWSSAKAYTYAFRMLHPEHPAIRFSPQWFYDFYVDQYSNGQDTGSIQTEDLKAVAQYGAVQYKYYPSAVPPRYPFPTPSDSPSLFANAALHHSPIQTQTLFMGNPSAMVYDEIKQALSTGQVAMLALNVTPSFDQATQNNGRIWYQGAETSRGGHAVNGIQVDDTMSFPDGSIGGVLIDNQWHFWGVNEKAWVSRAWLAQNAWGVMVISGGVTAKGKA